jgi:hypothetical protein
LDSVVHERNLKLGAGLRGRTNFVRILDDLPIACLDQTG